MHADLHFGRILSQLTILSGHHVAITLRFVVVLRNFVGTQLRGDTWQLNEVVTKLFA